MNRNEEFFQLKNSLEQMPASLEHHVENAFKKAKVLKKISFILKAILITISTFFISFVMLVNLSPAAAYAVSRLPIFKDLVCAVSFDSSLKLAVKNDYVQYVGDKKIKNKISVQVKYLIPDAGRISVFFKVDAPDQSKLNYYVKAFQSNGKPLTAAIYYTSLSNHKLQEVRIDMAQGEIIPNEIKLKFYLYDECKKDKVIQAPKTQKNETEIYSFLLYPKSTYLNKINKIPINQWVKVNQQKIYLKQLDIYPTQAKLYIQTDTENKAIIKGLDLYLVDEKGKHYNARTNGITQTLSSSSNELDSIWFDSCYFTNSKHLTLYINGIFIIDKDKKYGIIQYDTKTITNLPKGITVNKMNLKKHTLSFTLEATYGKNDCIKEFLYPSYFDNNGNEYSFGSFNIESNNIQGIRIIFSEYKIKNFKENTYKVQWDYARQEVPDKQIIVNLSQTK